MKIFLKKPHMGWVCRSKRSGTRGFTLIEVLVVVAIIAILVVLGVPSFVKMIQMNRLSAASSALQASLNLARSEAIKRGADARVTVAANTTAGNWGNGWTVFVDGTTNANAGVAPIADSAPSCTSSCVKKLEIIAAPAGAVSVGQTSGLNYFTYNGQGRLITSTGALANRSFWFFQSDSDLYCLVINNPGRVRTMHVSSSSSCATD